MSKARRLVAWFLRPVVDEDGEGIYDSVEMFVDDEGDVPVVARAATAAVGAAEDDESEPQPTDSHMADAAHAAPSELCEPDPADDAASAAAPRDEPGPRVEAGVIPSARFASAIIGEVIPGVVATPEPRRRHRWFDRSERPDTAADVFQFSPPRPVDSTASVIDVPAPAAPHEEGTERDSGRTEGDAGQGGIVDEVAVVEASSGRVGLGAATMDHAADSDEDRATRALPDASALVAETFADLAAALSAMHDQVSEIESEIAGVEPHTGQPVGDEATGAGRLAVGEASAGEATARGDVAPGEVGAGERGRAAAGAGEPGTLAAVVMDVAGVDAATVDVAMAHTATPTAETHPAGALDGAGSGPAPILPPREPPTKTRTPRSRTTDPQLDASNERPGEAAVDHTLAPPTEADRAWDRVAAALNDDVPSRSAPVAAVALDTEAIVPAVDAPPATPGEAMFSVRSAAHACAITPGSIRHHLRSGSFPHAVRGESGEWQIPLSDLERAGLDPITTVRLPEMPATSTALERMPSGALDSAGSDALVAATYARLRAEFAEAYANVQAERLMAEAEKWQMVAEERDRSLQRADEALKTVALAVESAARLVRAAAGLPDQPANPAPGQPAPAGTVRFGAKVAPPQPNATFVAVPDHVRDEARRLADALHASAPPRRRGRIF